MKGYVQVYTGNGKGKTTAAFGQALRAAGAGLRVFIAQFVKGTKYSEHKAMERFSDLITIKQYGRDCFINQAPTDKDIHAARQGYDDVAEIIRSGHYQMVILDEANIAVYYKLFSAHDLVALIDMKPEDLELVITGRYADPMVLEKADLVTEMLEVRHYYHRGVAARKGIEK
jgi:cob(I)alamin adenosyltransferase